METKCRGIGVLLLAAAGCATLGGCLTFDPYRMVAGITSVNVNIDGVTLEACASQTPTATTTGVNIPFQCTEQGTNITVNLAGPVGMLAVAFDPVILEVPASVNQFSGTLGAFVNGAVVQIPVQVTAGLASIPVDANTTLNAEPGMQLVILDLPSGTAPGNYALQFSFSPPNGVASIKAVFTAKVQVGNSTYYPILVPCVADFASVPAISTNTTLSVAQVVSLLASVPTCNNKVYDFTPAAATPVEVIEFYNAGLDHYFITWVTNEIHDLDTGVHAGWARTGKSFKTYNTSQPGTSPVCRFYIPPALGDSHFFGRGTTECNDTARKFPALTLEDPMFMFMYLPSAGTCPANTTEVHRAFDNRPDANHRYTTDPAVLAQMQSLGWVAEGDGPDLVVMCAPQ